MIADVALKYSIRDEAIPEIDYNENELGVWRHCYPKLKVLLEKNACEETNFTIKEMEKTLKWK